MARPGQEALRGAFWAEVEVGILKAEKEVRAWPSPAGDSSWPVPALPRKAPPPQPQAFPATSQSSSLGCPMPPGADSCPLAGPAWRAGADPTPCLTLSGLACAQLPGRGQGLSTPHSLPVLAEQSLHELTGAQGRDGQAGQWPKREVTSLAGVPCGAAHQPPVPWDRAGHGYF